MTRIAGWIERVLLAGGAALLAAWALGSLHARLLSGWDRVAFHAPAPMEAEPMPDTSDWSVGRIASHLAGATPLDAERVGLLQIPAIKLEVAVLEGTGELTLNRGVGRIEGTALPGRSGNAGIAGHRDGFFRGLERLGPGDLIRVTPPGMPARAYRIEWIRVVKPEDVWVLDRTDEPSLTLVTCHPFRFVGHAPDRYIVRAVASQTLAPRVAARRRDR